MNSCREGLLPQRPYDGDDRPEQADTEPRGKSRPCIGELRLFLRQVLRHE